MKTLRVKLNIKLRGKMPGTIFLVKADDKGIPVERYWRRRFKEAESNNCVEVVKKKTTKTKTQKPTTLEG